MPFVAQKYMCVCMRSISHIQQTSYIIDACMQTYIFFVKGQTQPDWKLKKNVKTTKKLENYMFMKDEMFKQNNKAKCQICANSDHEMRAKYTDMCA